MSEWTDIGEQLRKARESKGIDLKDVAHTTRIPLSTLTALEESDYSIFPSPSYARSFLSQYSQFLDVDAHEWIDAFETGDVLSNVNDHGYLQSHNEHIGTHRHHPEPARHRSRGSSRREDSSSDSGSSMLQTLTVFFVTALLIGGGIYAYQKYEPMLKGALNEETNDHTSDNPSPGTAAAQPPSTDNPSSDATQTPPLVAKNDPSTTDGDSNKGNKPNSPASTNQPGEGQNPAPAEPNRTGKPPKAMVIEEDE
ncbi:MAG: helix-turn-helix domain-containing protein [Akkermansiaceae bacterium]|nr:helix-turn-helix domain-containing protein [Akkermansiaceae bacterium]